MLAFSPTRPFHSHQRFARNPLITFDFAFARGLNRTACIATPPTCTRTRIREFRACTSSLKLTRAWICTSPARFPPNPVESRPLLPQSRGIPHAFAPIPRNPARFCPNPVESRYSMRTWCVKRWLRPEVCWAKSRHRPPRSRRKKSASSAPDQSASISPSLSSTR